MFIVCRWMCVIVYIPSHEVCLNKLALNQFFIFLMDQKYFTDIGGITWPRRLNQPHASPSNGFLRPETCVFGGSDIRIIWICLRVFSPMHVQWRHRQFSYILLFYYFRLFRFGKFGKFGNCVSEGYRVLWLTVEGTSIQMFRKCQQKHPHARGFWIKGIHVRWPYSSQIHRR